MRDFQRKFSMEKYRRESALKVARKKINKDTLKASLKDFEIPMRFWEQTAKEQSKWRGLINKGAAVYEKKRICEDERKYRERKAKINGQPADSIIVLLTLQLTV